MAVFYQDPVQVPLSGARPLLIVDADEVLVLFAAGFDAFLADRGCFLDFGSYHLLGNVRRQADSGALSDDETATLLEQFRCSFDALAPVPGALDALAELSAAMEIVVLSNMTAAHAPARLRNFSALGVGFPLLINRGLKGPAIRTLAERGGDPVFFVDDIPRHLESAAAEAPDTVRIHLVGDDRFHPVRPEARAAHLTADRWDEVVAFIQSACAGPGRA